jgi:hypothetical protein
MIHNNHPFMKSTAAKCQHIKGILVNTFVLKKKKQMIPKQEDEQDTLCPSIYSDDDSNSLTSTLFLPDDCSVQEEDSQDNMYSNLYARLPNGNWLVTYRTRDEKHLSSHEIQSYLI